MLSVDVVASPPVADNTSGTGLNCRIVKKEFANLHEVFTVMDNTPAILLPHALLATTEMSPFC
jgi:hypothetical protein